MSAACLTDKPFDDQFTFLFLPRFCNARRSRQKQKQALSQRHRGMGNDAEVMRLEALSAEVVKLSKPVQQEQR